MGRFNVIEEQVKACQIPEEKLLTISTKGLVETCLNYPLFGNLVFFNSIQEGFNQISSNFKGFDELYNRQDAGIILLNKYDKLSFDLIEPNWSELEKGTFMAKFLFLEVILSQEQIINQLSSENKIRLVKVCVDKYNSKKNLDKIFSPFSLSPVALIMGRVLQKEYKNNTEALLPEDENLLSFLSTSVLNDISNMQIILKQAKFYVSTK